MLVYKQIELEFTISQPIQRDVVEREMKRGRVHGLTAWKIEKDR